ncbi:hypothetical protein [Exiguobacterium sp. s154]|uniref:hypothetical protein n=1 Tax=Exiguobacterium sp. s154 TaxID=2751277 RepID=UPI002036F088|nr:hypothetical protein [Exiguobacterium sp. s154]
MDRAIHLPPTPGYAPLEEGEFSPPSVKGVLVLLVVFGHLLTDVRGAYDDILLKWVYLFLYTFHMPLFLMSISFALIIPGRQLPIFSRAGQYSLYVYLVHVFFVVAWKAFIPAGFMPTSWMQLLVLFGVAFVMVLVIISPLMVRLLRPLVEIDVKRVQNTKGVKG